MALRTIDEFDSSTHHQVGNYQIKGFEVHSDLVAGMLTDKTEEKIGVVQNILFDDAGQIQYVAVDLGSMGSGRTVLLPADRIHIDHDKHRVYAGSMTKEEAETLPAFDPHTIR